MAGHSKWANIKHRKALVDAKRSKFWSKLSKAIMVAAKVGGGDPATNIRLRNAILDAKAVSMPKENIERAIKRGAVGLDGSDVEEILYEGYGPGGVAVLCDIMTDNRNRTASEVRKIFDVAGGKLGATNCVAYLFERKGVLALPAEGHSLEAIMEIALEHGGDDVQEQEQMLEITCPPENYGGLVEALEQAGVVIESKSVSRIPATTVQVEDDWAAALLKMLDQLEDHDDIQSVATNANFEPHQLEAFG
jgi:YebC/PmpR family DNA-binding regulatory protein